MPTNAQIEAVARALLDSEIARWNVGRNRFDASWDTIGEPGQTMLIGQAKACIAAYEASRPAVATDEELAQVFAGALEVEHNKAAATTRPELAVQIMAGIRAVQERLTLAVPEVRMPEWVDNVSFYRHRWSDNQWSWTLEPDVMQRVEGAYREGSAPTFAEALADVLADVVAALAEAGKEGQE